MGQTDFIQYWDDCIRKWASDYSTDLDYSEDAPVPISETDFFWFEEQRHLGLHRLLMPEPYWGDIDCNSVVFLNMNPAGAEEESPSDTCHLNNRRNISTVCGLMADNYSAVAKKFPIFDGEFPFEYKGIDWWRNRVKWIEHFGIESSRRPFAIELCAWHSKKWKGGRYNIKKNPYIHHYISEIFGPALRRALRGSDARLILCIGKEFTRNVLPLVWQDIEDITEEIIGGINPVENNAREYHVLRIPGEGHVICTSTQGSNGLPSQETFGKMEKKLYNKIKNIQ